MTSRKQRKAAAVILGDEAVLVTDVVLEEAIWKYTGKHYGLDLDK